MKDLIGKRVFSLTFGLAALFALLATAALAGGPLLLGSNNQPILWPPTVVQGGPLNSQTVDGQGRVLYRVDMGDLGPIPHDKAVALIDRIFNEYSSIPTSTLRFANAGPIRDPNTGQPVDITSSNFGLVHSSSRPTFQNPIVFDSDGLITGGGGVLGFFGYLQFDDASNTIQEGFVVLNGASVNSVGGAAPFLGVFTHEIGHLAGPLDHEQINGAIASGSSSSVQPAGFTRSQVFDLFTPFTETLYPFIFNSNNARAFDSDLLAQGFGSSGFFIASLDFDTITAMSNLYPTPEYLASNGSIEGRVLIQAGTGAIPLSGMNVIARRIDHGSYPPPVSATAFPGFPSVSIQVDGDNVPVVPPAQDSTDSLAMAASAVTGLQFGNGTYRIGGLPPGQYLVELQRINPNATGGSGIGPLGSQIPLPVPEEYYNGPGNSSNSPSVFVPVNVAAGSITTGIDLIVNGLNLTSFSTITEPASHFKIKKAPTIQPPIEINGSASFEDPSQFKINLPDGSSAPVEDFFKFEVPTRGIYFILLEPVEGQQGDLDLYLFNADTVGKKKANLNDTTVVVGSSTSPKANEAVVLTLDAGTYIVGISPFGNSSVSYKLRIIAAQ
ncbi:MAG TPA: hypothetical protein VKM94_25730 [Blastocatellia bacterium]|nr:hypothetical protein [Blastocatellia bacterium]